ncbi:glycosyltransferase N-terminal domain-containing protein, partial [Paracoccus sanguinis]
MIYRSISGLVGAALRPLARGVARERLALDLPDLPDLPRGAIWVHGASVGELNSARPVVAALAAARPVVVSANSATGLDVARGWGLPALRAWVPSPPNIPPPLGRRHPLGACHHPKIVVIDDALALSGGGALRARRGG